MFSICISAQSWQPVGTGIEDTGSDGNAIDAFGVFNGNLYAVGQTYNNCPKNNIAVLNGSVWDTVGGGLRDTDALCFLAYDSLLFVGGQFNTAGNIHNVQGIATWDGTKWDSVGSGLFGIGGVYALSLYNHEVYAGGQLYNKIRGRNIYGVGKWNGNYWDSLGKGVNGDVNALEIYNGELYVGGYFDSAGWKPANNIARWNGAKWDSLDGGVNSVVTALCVYNGKLYVGGYFTEAGSMSVNYIATWDGTKWDTVGKGISGGSFPNVYTMCTYNHSLIVGGQFTSAGGKSAKQIARWNDTVWSALGAGFNAPLYGVVGLISYDSSLYAGGDFTKSGSTKVMGVAKWRDSVILEVNEITKPESVVKVYPNPSDGIFTIEQSAEKQNEVIEVYNVLGVKVFDKALRPVKQVQGRQAQGDYQINISSESSGVYFYRIISEKGEFVASGKLIIQ
jgi:hypothetical protein